MKITRLQIWIGEKIVQETTGRPITIDRLRGAVPLHDLGPVPLKNVSRPIPVYEVLDPESEETIRVDSYGTPSIRGG